MRILLVEDKAGFALDVERAIKKIPNCELVWAASRDAALAYLANGFFDLVILDRAIPTADGVLDDHNDHGWRVFQQVREHHPGTPVWWLTATEDADFGAEINNRYARVADIHGSRNPENMYKVWWKKQILECLREVRAFSGERDTLNQIPLRVTPADLVISPKEACILRQFGRQHGGTSLDIENLNGGLSNSRVLKAVIKDPADQPISIAAAKVGVLSHIQDEAGRYNRDVMRLAPGGFPQLQQIDVGGGNIGGLFYGLVGANVESLFDRLSRQPEEVADTPQELRRLENRWYEAKRDQQIQIGTLRRHLIGDAALRRVEGELQGIDVSAFERGEVTVSASIQHGDLHCANVVFDQRGHAMLIDFGEVGPSYSTIDPVALELSTVFHPDHRKLPGGWPSEAQMENWFDLDRYVKGCSFANFIRSCRAWANGEAGSRQEIVAAAYSYAMRQLKYPNTNKVLARALVRACLAQI